MGEKNNVNTGRLEYQQINWPSTNTSTAGIVVIYHSSKETTDAYIFYLQLIRTGKRKKKQLNKD